MATYYPMHVATHIGDSTAVVFAGQDHYIDARDHTQGNVCIERVADGHVREVQITSREDAPSVIIGMMHQIAKGG